MKKKKYAVIDLEMCKVPRNKNQKYPRLKREIIEIGAALIDENMEIVDSFQTYVKPEYGELDSFIIDLTGIHNENLKDAPVFRDALEAFVKWLPKDVTLVAWSENDEIQMDKEMEFKEIEMPEFEKHFGKWENCQAEFSERLERKNMYNLSEALIIANIYFDENIHDALVDAQNTALLYIKMRKEEKLQLSPYYSFHEESTQDDSSKFCPFANLFN